MQSLHKIHCPMVIDLCVIDLWLEHVHTFARQHMKLASDRMKQYNLSVGYIPAKRDIRPVISRGKGQCSSEAEEVPRVKPEVLPRLNESTDLSRGI